MLQENNREDGNGELIFKDLTVGAPEHIMNRDNEIVINATDGFHEQVGFQRFEEIVEGVGIFCEDIYVPEERSFVTVSWKSEKLPRAIKVWLETITHPRNCQFCDKLRQKALSEPSTSSSHQQLVKNPTYKRTEVYFLGKSLRAE